MLSGLRSKSLPLLTSIRTPKTSTLPTWSRCLSSSSSSSSSGNPPSKSSSFRPRRRTPRSYRPIPSRALKPKGPKSPFYISNRPKPIVIDGDPSTPDDDEENDIETLFQYHDGELDYDGLPEDSDDPIVAEYGEAAADAIRYYQRMEKRGGLVDYEDQLRYADYLTADDGTTEERVLERKAMAEGTFTEAERVRFRNKMEELFEQEKFSEFDLGDDDLPPRVDPDDPSAESGEDEDEQEPHVEAVGKWSEVVIRIDRVQKVQRGGTMVRYRALVVGGNMRGVAGFGVGKASGPKEAVAAASRKTKQNIFFFKPYKVGGLTYDLVGKHNSCKVTLKAVSYQRGLHGHPLIRDMLILFGITDCTAKSYGNQNIYSVVYATFKAIMTHQSIEEVALRRGKRFLNIDRARRIQLE